MNKPSACPSRISSLFVFVTCVASYCCSCVNGEGTITIPPHTFKIQDGYEVIQVAAPPLVNRPMHMCFDDTGVLYVTDSSGNTDKAPVQVKDPQHRVLRLVDRDGDGRFDESTVFADQLPLPEGILVHDGSVYVGAPPHIWKLHDSNGDHVADERTVWFDGGSIENCGNDMHGPYYGPDGFFYWCKGAFAPQQHQLSNGRTRISHAAHIYRSRPDRSQLERVMTGGMNNPVGLAFSDSGERFLSGTFFDLSAPGRRDGVLHAVYGGIYGRKNPRVLKPHPSTGDLLPVLSHLGPAAPSGIVMPRSGSSGLSGDLVCTEFNTRRLSRHTLESSGSSFGSTVTTFMESDQTDFHPTDVIEDADGTLLIADTGSWYMICCPTSKIAKPDILGAIYRVKKKGVITTEDPRGLALDWQNPQVEWLSDERPAVVKRAIDSLASKDNIDTLRLSPARISAIWTLHRIPGADARQCIRQFIKASDPTVSITAMQSVALWRDHAAVAELIARLSENENPHVLRVAVMALGRIGQREAVRPLLECYSSDMDPFLKHAILYAIYEIGDVRGLPEGHLITKQVKHMLQLDKQNIAVAQYPEIRLAKPDPPNPEMIGLQKQRLEAVAPFLSKGDPQRGQKLFHDRERSKCVTCHLMGQAGVRLGPDLTSIGAVRSERDLLEAIVLPSASIARYHETVNVVTKKGTVVSGLVVQENENALFLASAEGVMQRVAYTDIEQASYSNTSLMPDGYDKVLAPEEIADLVAFLKESKSMAGAVVKSPAVQRLPPHREVTVPGLHAYAQKSIAAGEDIAFRVSSEVPYRLSVVRLGEDPDKRSKDTVLKSFYEPNPQSQSIHPGSYVHVDKGLPSGKPLLQLTLECWIRPFSLTGWQGLVTQHDFPHTSGIGLFLNDGRVVFMTGDGGEFNPSFLHQTESGLITTQRWHHVVGTWDGSIKRIFIDGTLVSEFPFHGVVRPGKTAIRIGAYGSEGVADKFYDGDIAMVAIYDRALPADEHDTAARQLKPSTGVSADPHQIAGGSLQVDASCEELSIRQRLNGRGLTLPTGTAVLACWPFVEERGTHVADAGADGRHGQIINRGTWMIGGPSFDASAIDRHDLAYDPTLDVNRGHSLRLASDELYNARWDISHVFRVPSHSKSGIYAGRFDFEIDGEPRRSFTSFVVRRGATEPQPRLLVLTASNTWLAYNSVPFPVNRTPGRVLMGTGGLENSQPLAPAYSCYRDHSHGQPTYKVGMKLPWPAAGPDKTYINNSYSHLMRGERFLHLWLDEHGYDYDVLTDRDVDRNPSLLNGYEAVVINGHSEYWSARAYEGIDTYLRSGGDVIVLSGNTMFWRVTYDEDDEYMECRKYGAGIGGRRLAQVGELYHSCDQKRGSLMRFCGYPAWKVVGLTCIGWGGAFQPYKVDQPEHFLFNYPNKVGLKKGETFGWIREGVGAVGHEFDVRLSTLQRATSDTAVKGLVEPRGITTLARSEDSRRVIDYNAEGHKPRSGNEQTIAEIIYWERPNGGRVFHTGSIATAWGVYHDETMGALLENVLNHFDIQPSREYEGRPIGTSPVGRE